MGQRGSKELPSYDFLFPKEIPLDELSNYQLNEIKLLETNKERMIFSNQWLELISRLPRELYLILKSEINHGNLIKNIGQANWPNKGSIVIQMIKYFQIENKIKFDIVNWQYLNDPHYCQEKLSQKVDDVEHLIIFRNDDDTSFFPTLCNYIFDKYSFIFGINQILLTA